MAVVFAADPAAVYAFEFVDVDGHKVSTADGHTTMLVFTSSRDTDRAHDVGDRVPDFCLGNPDYRMVTVIELASSHAAPAH